MSHELRTPLHVVIGYSDALQREAAACMSPEQVAEYAATINKAGHALLSLVESLLEALSAEAGAQELASDLMQVDRLLASVAAQAQAAAQAAGLALTAEPPPEIRLLRGDERRLRVALGQLLGNAIKFTPPGGQVALAAATEPATGDLTLTVRDTGIGIAPGDLERVFEPFLQLDGGLTRRFPGSGLGLYVSRMTARAHGGDLTLSSQAGAGTVAVLRLPAERLVVHAPTLLP